MARNIFVDTLYCRYIARLLYVSEEGGFYFMRGKEWKDCKLHRNPVSEFFSFSKEHGYALISNRNGRRFSKYGLFHKLFS